MIRLFIKYSKFNTTITCQQDTSKYTGRLYCRYTRTKIHKKAYEALFVCDVNCIIGSRLPYSRCSLALTFLPHLSSAPLPL